VVAHDLGAAHVQVQLQPVAVLLQGVNDVREAELLPRARVIVNDHSRVRKFVDIRDRSGARIGSGVRRLGGDTLRGEAAGGGQGAHQGERPEARAGMVRRLSQGNVLLPVDLNERSRSGPACGWKVGMEPEPTGRAARDAREAGRLAA
jgi:hypothetical protein